MIVVIGEALVDLVIDPDGNVTAALGGAPFNAARACGRLGADVAFSGTLSIDRFGSMLHDQLVADGVDVSRVERVELPTTLAAAELDDGGTASYRFYIDGTSAPALTNETDLAGVDIVFTGGLGLALEPMALSVEATMRELGQGTLAVVDVNCRPLVVRNRNRYVDRVDQLMASTHVVKVSDEDLDYLAPDLDHVRAAQALLDRGSSAVLLTAAGGDVNVVTESGVVTVPVVPVEVVDTIGAGDTFIGSLMAWLAANGHGVAAASDPDLMAHAVRAAITAAGVACTRRGADPPGLGDLPASWLC